MVGSFRGAVLMALLVLLSPATHAAEGPPLSLAARRAVFDDAGNLNLENLDWLAWRFDQDAIHRADWDALKNWVASRQSEMTADMRQKVSAVSDTGRNFSHLPIKCYGDRVCAQLADAIRAADKFSNADQLRAAIADARPIYLTFLDTADAFDRWYDPDRPATLPERIVLRSRWDQAHLTAQMRLRERVAPRDARFIVRLVFDVKLGAIWRANATYLQSYVGEKGWPTISDAGESIATLAWAIAQHADHAPDFQVQVLKLLRPLVDKGAVERPHYAYLYDRVNVRLGLPQLYGTQFHCVNGKLELEKLERPHEVDALRKEMEMGPLKNYSVGPADRSCDG